MLEDFYQKPFPTLEIDEHYCLREQDIKDTKAFFTYYKDPDVTRYILANVPKNMMEASAEIQYCRNLFYYQKGIYWALARKSDQTMVGAIGIYINNQHRRGEICYDLAKTHWNQGLMTGALSSVITCAFETMGLARLEAVTLQNNEPSIHVLKKLGFTFEGTLKQYRYFQGSSHDVEIFSLTKAQAKVRYTTFM